MGHAVVEKGSLVPDDRFRGPDDPIAPGHWAVGASPVSWAPDPETLLLRGEILDVVRAAVRGLPSAQQAVITLRDMEGMPAEETCHILGISRTNQRVLLHRARMRVRDVLDGYVRGG